MMRFGVVILPEYPWQEATPIWRRAEQLGFHHAWTYDHLAWRSLRDSPWFGSIPTLTAASLVTSRIRLGTLVASANFRHPVPFAKELTTLDDISGGRFTLGIGAGADGWDATMLGVPAWSRQERAERFAEFVHLSDRLLREPATSYAGRFYAADEARTYPGCVQRPRIPFAIAATGPQGMRLVAKYGQAWVTTGDRERPGPVSAKEGAGIVRAQLARLEAACADAGRDPGSLERLVVTGPQLEGGLSSLEAFRDAVGRYTEVGITDFVVHWPRSEGPYAADPAVFERIFAEVRI
jgi:alkanesulfonate monooxygenase SsuD/methylene tetrahydromethanopterin reductase-like flavin-dependent oxidoreductase (luciferase family)